MSDQFIAEIRLFAGNFPPRGWAFCSGQILSIAQNTALFSLVGTYYGGDGRTTFGLPNLNARAPICPGQGPGLSPRDLGETGGAANVTLTPAELPNHSHTLGATTSAADSNDPNGRLLAATTAANPLYVGAPGAPIVMGPGAAGSPVAADAHNNLQPFLGVSFIIALTGIYPPRG